MLKNAKVLKVYRKELNTRRTREKIINEQQGNNTKTPIMNRRGTEEKLHFKQRGSREKKTL